MPLLLIFVLVCPGTSGCADPAGQLTAFEASVEAGEPQAAEDTLREALERHPRDVELLVAGAEFYLRPEPEEFYRPRLALHYAMRADQAAEGREPRATSAMVRAHRGAGGFAETEDLVRAGLGSLQHPDADAPVLLEPVDPDLLEPSLPNLLEQRRRRDAGSQQPGCPESQLLVPAGRYPGSHEVAAFCVERRGRPVEVECSSLGLRSCSAAEDGVVVGAIGPLLDGDGAAHRCCSGPSPPRFGAEDPARRP